MPCTITGSFEGDARLAAQEATIEARIVTQQLCATCRAVEENNMLHILPKATQTWWKKHKAQDAQAEERKKKNERRELMRKKAISKLSKEERDALGLNP